MNGVSSPASGRPMFAKPDWRWQRAYRLWSLDGKPPPKADPGIRNLWWVLRSRVGARRHRTQPRAVADAIRGAIALRQNGAQAVRVEALLLAGLDDDAIAARLAIEAGVVGWFEKLFFDVRDRLRASDWIHRHAIPRRSGGRSCHSCGEILRHFAYQAGIEAYGLVLAVLEDQPLPEEVRPIAPDPAAEQRLRAAVTLLVEALGLASPGRLAACVAEWQRIHRSAKSKAGGGCGELIDSTKQLLRLLGGSRGEAGGSIPSRRSGPRKRADAEPEDSVLAGAGGARRSGTPAGAKPAASRPEPSRKAEAASQMRKGLKASVKKVASPPADVAGLPEEGATHPAKRPVRTRGSRVPQSKS